MVAIVKTKILKATKFINKYTFPDEIGNVIIKNISSKSISIWFDNEKVDDSYSLQSLETTPAIKVQSNTIYFCVPKDTGEFNLLMWE